MGSWRFCRIPRHLCPSTEAPLAERRSSWSGVLVRRPGRAIRWKPGPAVQRHSRDRPRSSKLKAVNGLARTCTANQPHAAFAAWAVTNSKADPHNGRNLPTAGDDQVLGNSTWGSVGRCAWQRASPGSPRGRACQPPFIAKFVSKIACLVRACSITSIVTASTMPSPGDILRSPSCIVSDELTSLDRLPAPFARNILAACPPPPGR